MENDDVKKVKNRYKKLCKNVLSVLSIVILLVLIYIICSVNMLKNIFDHNVGLDISKNSKVEYYLNDRLVNITYFKDGVIKMDATSGDDIDVFVVGDKWYSSNNKEKYYMDLDEMMIPYNQGKSFSTFGNGSLNVESFDSFWDVLKLKFENNIRMKNETENGKDYIIIRIGNDAKLWVDKETLLVEKELENGLEMKHKLELNTVNDEEMKFPWDKGYVDIRKQNENK